MSTCPSKELFSAYLDNEIPSPWKEQLAAHLQECYECQKQYDCYQKLHTMMQCYAFPIQRDFNQSFSTLTMKRNVVLQRRKTNQKELKKHWIYASISIPVPAVAAALLLLILMPVLFLLKKTPGQTSAVSFKPIVPVSLERQRKIRQFNCSGLYSTDITYPFPEKKIITEELFTVSDFAMLYANRENFFSDLPNIYLTAAMSDTVKFHNWPLNMTVQPNTAIKTAMYYK